MSDIKHLARIPPQAVVGTCIGEVGEGSSRDPSPVKPARVLLADPPWAFGDKLPGNGRGAVKHYPCLSVAELEAFPLPPLADDALLILWRVAAMPSEALAVVRAWGFTPKSEIVWVKTTKENVPGRLAFGMGRYVRAAHETCILATRGRVHVNDRAVRSVFFAPRQEHSRKPDCLYDLIERLSAGPYCELFARRRRAGWRQFGSELASLGPETPTPP